MHHLRGEFRVCHLANRSFSNFPLPCPPPQPQPSVTVLLSRTADSKIIHLGTALTCPIVQMLTLTRKFIPPIQRPHFLVAGLELSHAFYSVSLPWVSEPPLTRSLALKSRHAWGKFPALNQTHPPPKKRQQQRKASFEANGETRPGGDNVVVFCLHIFLIIIYIKIMEMMQE